MKYLNIDPIEFSLHIIKNGLTNGVTTTELDNYASKYSASNTTLSPDYSILAARIAISNNHKNTSDSFFNTMKSLHEFSIFGTGFGTAGAPFGIAVAPGAGVVDDGSTKIPMVSDTFMEIVKKYQNQIENAIDHQRDFILFDYF